MNPPYLPDTVSGVFTDEISVVELEGLEPSSFPMRNRDALPGCYSVKPNMSAMYARFFHDLICDSRFLASIRVS